MSIYISFADETNMLQKQATIEISGELYKNWGSDDDYIFNFIDSNLDHFFLGKDLVIPNFTETNTITSPIETTEESVPTGTTDSIAMTEESVPTGTTI